LVFGQPFQKMPKTRPLAIQDLTFLLMLYVILFFLLCFKTARAITMITPESTTPLTKDVTKALVIPLSPVQDKTYCKKQAYMEPHPVHLAT